MSSLSLLFQLLILTSNVKSNQKGKMTALITGTWKSIHFNATCLSKKSAVMRLQIPSGEASECELYREKTTGNVCQVVI